MISLNFNQVPAYFKGKLGRHRAQFKNLKTGEIYEERGEGNATTLQHCILATFVHDMVTRLTASAAFNTHSKDVEEEEEEEKEKEAFAQ